MRALPVAVLAVALVVTGCSSTSSDTGTETGAVEPVESPAAGTVALLPAEQFAVAAEQPGVVLLDVRTPAEYADGHIDGAANIDLNAPDFADRVAELDPTVTYAVYCRSGNRSATATAYMLQQGFAPPYELAGGIVAWQSAGLPVA
jgi:phage shock protein E